MVDTYSHYIHMLQLMYVIVSLVFSLSLSKSQRVYNDTFETFAIR